MYVVSGKLTEVQVRLLRQTAENHRRTYFMVGLAIWALLLADQMKKAKVAPLINTTARQLQGCESAFGFYYDLGVIPIQIQLNDSFQSYLDRIGNEVILHQKQYVPCIHLYEGIPNVRRLFADRRFLLIPFQTKRRSTDTQKYFGDCWFQWAASTMSHNVGFSLPLDGLMSLEKMEDGYEIVFEFNSYELKETEAIKINQRYLEIFDYVLMYPEIHSILSLLSL